MESTPTGSTTDELTSFDYRAQSEDQQPLSGTLDAPNINEAGRILSSLKLRVMELRPLSKPRPKPIAGDDFVAFNQQLAQLASAGLPVEHGLRLIAQDIGSRRLASTIKQVADELDAGTSLGEAFEKHRSKFPPLYGRLVAAGVRAANLPGMLFNLGRHMALTQRLRAALWRATAYPMMVLLALGAVIFFLGIYVIPKFEEIFRSFQMRLPVITEALLSFSRLLPVLLVPILVLIFAMPIIWLTIRKLGWDQPILDWLVVPLPLIGPVLKRNLIARWCDAMKLGVDARLDLPQAVELAGDTINSSRISQDGRALIAAIESGQPIESVGSLRILPRTIPAAIAFSAQQNQLSETLAILSRMYEEQAELRVAALPALLTPILLLLLALIMAFVIIGLLAPLVSLIQGVSGS